MPMPMLRYDIRQPHFSEVPRADLYSAAIDQCEWGEKYGLNQVHLSEHHGSEDGYCPSPLVLAAAIAARTEHTTLFISALIAPLHDPVRLAEDLAVLDLISRGRVIPVLGAGYREEEFAAVGKTLADRRDYMDAIGPFLEKAFSGETFEFEGRSVSITPRPHSRPRPPIFMGGSSRAAARRAARHADYFIPTGAEIFEFYREELRALGKPDPGPLPRAPETVTFLAEDPDVYWEKIGPHCRHETNSYAAWSGKSGTHSPYRHYDDLDALRAGGGYRVYRPDELIEAARAMPPGQPILFHPLCGGIHPALAWESLRLWAEQVLPALRADNLVPG